MKKSSQNSDFIGLQPDLKVMPSPKSVLLIGPGQAAESATVRKPLPTSVVTSMNFGVSAEIAWQGLMLYEEIKKPPPWLLRLLLPIPLRAEGRHLEVDDVVKCHYTHGHLLKRVTKLNYGQEYAFEVIEQKLLLHGDIKLLGGSYKLRKQPGPVTEVILETRYARPNRPRWWRNRIERVICHLFHRHILKAMHKELELK